MIKNRIRMGNHICVSRATLKEMVQQCQTYERLGFEPVAPYVKRTYLKAMYSKTTNYGIEQCERYIIFLERKEQADEREQVSE